MVVKKIILKGENETVPTTYQVTIKTSIASNGQVNFETSCLKDGDPNFKPETAFRKFFFLFR